MTPVDTRNETDVQWATRKLNGARDDAAKYREHLTLKYGQPKAVTRLDNLVVRWERIVAALVAMEGK